MVCLGGGGKTPKTATGPESAETGGVRRTGGCGWGRLLQHAEVHGRTARNAGRSALVEVAFVHDVAVRLRALHRAVSVCAKHVSDLQIRARHGPGRRNLLGAGLSRCRLDRLRIAMPS